MWLSGKGNRWSGALNECDEQCTKAAGEVCNEFPKSCCQKGSCKSKFGVLTCEKEVEGFKCEKGRDTGLDYLQNLIPQLKNVRS